MFTATDLTTRKSHNFSDLDSLARRLGGNDWRVEHNTIIRPPTTRVQILRANRLADGFDIVTMVTVPTEAVESAEAAKWAE